jgi:nitroimidazol reductase NimA-like FMN-containing flavoprotein (pyridoxamine 5'-phosphate oxidase superfamily)
LPDEEPYVVTLSYGYEEKSNTIYSHCASEGQKIGYIKRNPYVCATIIEDKGYVEGDCSP